jgi:hypothetical protein
MFFVCRHGRSAILMEKAVNMIGYPSLYASGGSLLAPCWHHFGTTWHRWHHLGIAGTTGTTLASSTVLAPFDVAGSS